MKIHILATTVLVCAALASPVAFAQGKSGGKPEKADRQMAAQAEQRMQKREDMRKRGDEERDAAQERAEQARDASEQREEQARERAEYAREEAEEMAEREMAEDRYQGDASGQDNAATRGNEKSQEMRARRDERKEIMEEYRDGREAGDDGIDQDAEREEIAEEQQAKAKKPWWKFWGD